MNHEHVSALDALSVFAYIIIFGFLWRSASAELAERGGHLATVGKAMGFIF